MVIAEGRKQPSAEDRIRLPKLLPREYSGPRHIVAVGQRPDGQGEYEERPGAPPPNQGRGNDETLWSLVGSERASYRQDLDLLTTGRHCW